MRSKLLPGLILTATLGLATVLRLWNITQSFWWDEVWSTMPYAAARSILHTVGSLGYYFNNHILYSLLCRVCLGLFGESEAVARVPAVIMGLLGVVLLYRFARQYTSQQAALLAALFLAISAFHIDHSTEARGYGGLMLLGLAGSQLFLTALKTNRTRHWCWYAIITVLGMYMHAYMVLVCLSQAVCAVVLQAVRRRALLPPVPLRRFSISLGIAAAATLVLYSPVLRQFIVNTGKVRTVDVSRLPFLVTFLKSVFPGITCLPGALLYSAACTAGLVLLGRRADAAHRELVLYTVILLVLPISLYISINPMFIFERYFVFTLPFWLLLLAHGICAGSALVCRSARVQALVVLLATAAVTVLQVPATWNIVTVDRQNYREAVRFVEQAPDATPDDYLFTIGWAGTHFNYYSRTAIDVPKTFAAFQERFSEAGQSWCLITAWLPWLRPPGEDLRLYAEPPGHDEIYDFVMNNFQIAARYQTKFPTLVLRYPPR